MYGAAYREKRSTTGSAEAVVCRCITTDLMRRGMQKLVLILIAFIALVTFIRAFDREDVEVAESVAGSSLPVFEQRVEDR
jgi:hypothetical protein